VTVVLDASVLAAAIADSGHEGEWATELVTSGTLLAPHLAMVECANVLRRATLAGRLDESVAAQAHADLLALNIELLPYAPFAERVWELRGTLTAYDAWYVAVAEAAAAPLATLDRRLVRAKGPRCRFLLP
jgi:predicted nucleic acid-binding protein